ncbi:MAG: hypothetical protein ACOX66_08920 [Oscillospiraceae bacterium]
MERSEQRIRRTIDGRELTFVRRASDGHELQESELAELGVTNDTITHIVSSVAGRIRAAADGSFSANIIG